jgi:hypothetical protein
MLYDGCQQIQSQDVTVLLQNNYQQHLGKEQTALNTTLDHSLVQLLVLGLSISNFARTNAANA